ncbi:hypothetical protein Unana1_01534 [Umbelopsis nana]
MSTLKVMTFNVRFDLNQVPERQSAEDSLSGEQPWSLRKWKVADTILLYGPDIVGLQEPRHHQVLDLAELLISEYDWIGCGRNDGKEDGEYAPIFYKRQVLSVANNKTIWLSETPDQPGSKSWDADQTRIANIATFNVKGSNQQEKQKQIAIINTHFDNRGATSRRESALILLKKLASMFEPTLLIGDLNSPEDDPAYLELTCGRYKDKDTTTGERIQQLNTQKGLEKAKQTGQPIRTSGNSIILPTHIQLRRGRHDPANLKPLNERHGFKDSRYELESRLNGFQGLSGPYGHQLTFTGFGAAGEDPPARIDYILYANNIKATRYAVLENRYDDNLYISDHRPVMATVSF